MKNVTSAERHTPGSRVKERKNENYVNSYMKRDRTNERVGSIFIDVTCSMDLLQNISRINFVFLSL